MCAINNSTKNSCLFDFEDGQGLVPAHKHAFGGGWIADSAKVENSVYVGAYARVYGYAHISDNAKIDGDSRISGQAEIRDNVCTSGRVKVQGRALVEGDIVLENECFVGAGTHLKGSFRIGDHATFMQTTRCLECPLLRDSYGATTENPCANCLSAMIKRNNETSIYRTRHGRRYTDFVDKGTLISAFEAGNARGTD